MPRSFVCLASLSLVLSCLAAAPSRADTALQGYIKASNTGNDDGFGWSLATSGDTIVVGAWEEDSNATGVNGNQTNNLGLDSGAVYVFVRNGSTWSQQAYLKGSNTEAGDRFGYAVAISGDTLVATTRFESSAATTVNGDQTDNSAFGAGAAYVFVRNGTTWTQQAYLKASNAEGSDFFGTAVGISGDTIAVSADRESSIATGVNGNQADNSAVGAGAVYVFVRNGTTWSQQAYLKASNTQDTDQFGFSLGISGDTIAVGATSEGSNATGVNGNQNNESAPGSGAVYVFVRNGTTWSQQAYVKASNTGVASRFGHSTAVWGDSLIVGATGEASNATGINGDQTNTSAAGSGAAYAFRRLGTTWSQEAYLKASNCGPSDAFGSAVAAYGDVFVVGAVGEGSNATGINGNQANNSFFAAGAAYVFVRAGPVWSQLSYVKASNTGNDDAFGLPVAYSAGTLAVSAYREDGPATGVGGDGSLNSAPNSGAAYAYFVDAGQTAFCEGDGTSRNCPCSPVPVPHGTPGRGCPNNISALGASLIANGNPSLSADTLLLLSNDMNNGTCAYFQGDALQTGGFGAHFGDGLRCVRGTQRLFKNKPVSGGSAIYPGAGETPISVAGLVLAPGQRYYQGWYRSAAPSFCTPDTFNLTNGVAVTWKP